MKTSPLKYLATLLTCTAILAGGEVSAQTDITGYTARPLPPLPTNTKTQRRFINTVPTKTETIDSGVGTLSSKTLSTEQSPPVPPGFDVSARIILPATVEPSAPPAPIQLNQQTELTNLDLETTVATQIDVVPTNVDAPPAVIPPRVAELPSDQDPGRYVVSFVKHGEDEGGQGKGLEPILDSPGPEIDEPSDSESEMTSDEDSDDSDGMAEQEDEDEQETEDSSDEDLGDDESSDDDEEEPKRAARQFGVWPKKSMQEVRVDVREFGAALPEDESAVLLQSTQRHYRSTPNTEKVFAWAAPNIRHQPLYFEDVQLERYGQTRGLKIQPIVSAFKFLRDGALLPLNASIDPPCSRDRPLGYCRPGSPASECGCPRCKR